MSDAGRRDRREAAAAFLVPLALAALGLWILGRADLDGRITERFFDRATGTWPLCESFLFKRVLHDRARDAVFLVAFAALVTAIAGCFVPRLAGARRPALFVVLSVAASTGIVALLKHASPVPSPWESLRFGGTIPHLSPFADYPEGVAAGRCFPGAHAAGGFALMCSYYVLRERRRRAAWAALFLGLAVGLVYGAAQVARGAHYPSHNLWSAAIVWVVCSLLYHIAFRGRLWAVVGESDSASDRLRAARLANESAHAPCGGASPRAAQRES